MGGGLFWVARASTVAQLTERGRLRLHTTYDPKVLIFEAFGNRFSYLISTVSQDGFRILTENKKAIHHHTLFTLIL